MKRVLTAAAAMRREDRLQQREDRLSTKNADLKAEIERLRGALNKLLNCVDGIHTQAHLERCKIAARAALQPKEGEV